MMLYAYSIFDTKALVYSTPWFQVNDQVAVRIVSELANDPSTNVGRHPSDYILYRIGSYMDEKGELLGIAPRVHVVDVISLVTRHPDLFSPNVSNKLNGTDQVQA